MTKNEAINILVKCVKLYKENLEGKSLLIIFENNNEINKIEIIFSKSNFQHLTGIELDNKKQVKSFYNRCLNKVISEKDIKFKKDGTTELKLSVLEQLMNMNTNARMIGEYNFSKIYLYTDKVLGGIHATIGLKKVNNYYVANTALKEDIRNVAIKTNRIICIMSKEISKKLYEEITYIAKNIDIDKVLKDKNVIKNINFKCIFSKNTTITKFIKKKFDNILN